MKLFSMKNLMAAILCIVMVLSLCAWGPSGVSTEVPDADTTSVTDNEAGDNTGNKVYLAGPLFSEGERDYNLQITKVLEDNGYQVFLPQRDGMLATELEGKTEEEKTRMRVPVLNSGSDMRMVKDAMGSRQTPDLLNWIWI